MQNKGVRGYLELEVKLCEIRAPGEERVLDAHADAVAVPCRGVIS